MNYLMQVTIVGVWILSALISSPRFYYFSTMSMPHADGKVEILCLPNRLKYNSKTADMISMVLLFLVPLLVITVLYFRIGVSLWKSSNGRMPSASTSAESSSSSCRECCESTAMNNPANHPLNSCTSSPASAGTRGNSHGRRAFLLRLNCLRCKKESRSSSSRHRRTCGSFYGADKLVYKTVNPTNSTINGTSNGSLVAQGSPQAAGAVDRRNTNGLLISCDGNTLHPINSNSALHSTNGHPSSSSASQLSPHKGPGALGANCARLSLKCCGCNNVILNPGCESVPVSPYLKRDSTPLSPPPPAVTISSSEPIVLVKFEKKRSHKKCKRNKCTVLIRSAMSAATFNGKGGSKAAEGCENDNGELSSLSNNTYSRGDGICGSGLGGVGGGSTCRLTASNGTLQGEGCGCGCSDCAGEIPSMIAYCQLCQKRDGGTEKNLGIQHQHHDAHPGFAVGHHGILSANSVEGRRCDKNLDCIGGKESIPAPTSHATTITFGNGHHCPSLTTSSTIGHHAGCNCSNSSSVPFSSPTTGTTTTTYVSNFKGQNHGTAKGPKRTRVIRSSKYGMRALQCRRRIIRMLIVIVVAFAMCHLPFHARKIWQYWGKGYEAASMFSQLFTPVTFLIMYAQSGMNPILYAFMSRKFRSSFADLLCCNMRRSFKISRNFSVRSTNAIQLSQTT
jgi:hypothetical protein